MMMLPSITEFFLLIAASLFCISSRASDTLTPGELLSDGPDGGTFLISAGEIFKLGFFSPNGSDHRYIGIWYNKISVQTVVWVANRQRPITGRSGRLSVSPNGTLVIADENSTIFWSSTPGELNKPVAQVLDDGNFVVREGGGDADSFVAWQSFDHPSDTVLPGMKLGWNLMTRFNRNSTSWRSDSDPSPGDYVLGLDLNGDPQLFLWSGSRKYWRGGPWNGVGFTGAPEMASESIISWEFVADDEEVVFWYQNRSPIGPSTITRMYVPPSGMVQRLMWNEGTKSWTLIRFVGRDECAGWSPCGPNSLCSPDLSPMCSCLQGFRPKNPRDWNSMLGFDGCVRKTNLDCANQTDGFIKHSSLKLPDTSTSTVDWSMSVSLEECRALCLRNCSCTAYASANISAGSGSGCIIWTGDLSDMKIYHGALGQDLYVRVAAPDLGSSHSRTRRVVVAIITVSSVLPFLLASLACYVWRRNKTSRFVDEDQTEQGNDLNLPLFDLDSIVDATGSFSAGNKLGEGGFGPVYKGKLRQGQEIAVKRLSTTSTQGVDEFKNEVKLIAKLQHRNLVRLLGCCIQGGERLLIYEYMPNGSLDTILFDKTKRQMLDWNRRYNIIIGIARGLLYLHQDSRFTIIHRDLKASNILLDDNLNPKISDFGMAKMFGGDETMGKTTRVVGTYGYMSPEYVMCGTFSIKSDIFSFGVLILEIISGKKNTGVHHFSQQLNLLEYIWSLWRKGNALDSVDASLGDSFSTDEVLRCINIGLLCVQERPLDRPAMSSLILMLCGDNPQLPEPKRPAFIITRDASETNSSLSREDLSSRNNMTITSLEGR